MSATTIEAPAVTATWTKHNDEWAVCVPPEAEVNTGDKIIAVNRAGVERDVTLLAHVADKPWGAVWLLAPRDPEQTETIPEGYYLLDGKVYKVRISKKGNAYATVLHKVRKYRASAGAADHILPYYEGKWEYVPGAIKSLTTDHAITVEQAAEYGHLHGLCAICGKTLTDPESVQRGIGPVCAKRI